MRIIKQRTLREFATAHPAAKIPIAAWTNDIRQHEYRTPQQIKNVFGSVDFVGDDRAVFNIGGNNFRLVAHINYRLQIAFIKFVGTHSEYDKIDARTVSKY